MISAINLKNYISFPKQTIPSFGLSQQSDNKLERTPSKDSLAIKCNYINTKKSKLSQQEMQFVSNTFNLLKKTNILPEHILYFLKPKIDAKGREIFTPSQANVIDAAMKKAVHFKNLAISLETDAKKYGKTCADQMVDVFGGEKGLGKYITYRVKGRRSIYDKLIKEFNDNKINTDLMSVISNKVFGCSMDDLDKDDKELLKLYIKDGEIKLDSKDYQKMVQVFKHTSRDHIESINWIKDLVGTRLILPKGDKKELELVEKYLDKAIKKGELFPTRVSNYHANHILPYIKHDTAKLWKQIIPGLKVVETAEVRKKNGYTTTQINVVHKISTKNGIKDLLGEFQIRTQELNYIGDVEHLIYDILQKKDISKGIPELKEYYDKIGIEKAVKELFNDKKKEQNYFNYERAMYYWVRNKETQTDNSRKYPKPRLHEYGLEEYWRLLSFDSLRRIDEKANEIKQRYYEKNKLEK